MRRLGDRVLALIMPILREGLRSDDPEHRQGVCLGLTEVIGASQRRQLEDYLAETVPAVQDVRGGKVPIPAPPSPCPTHLPLLQHADAVWMVLLSFVQALCDMDESVREAAAQAFSNLQRTVGSRALDDIVPGLLRAVNTDDPAMAERALHGLAAILSMRR